MHGEGAIEFPAFARGWKEQVHQEQRWQTNSPHQRGWKMGRKTPFTNRDECPAFAGVKNRGPRRVPHRECPAFARGWESANLIEQSAEHGIPRTSGSGKGHGAQMVERRIPRTRGGEKARTRSNSPLSRIPRTSGGGKMLSDEVHPSRIPRTSGGEKA